MIVYSLSIGLLTSLKKCVVIESKINFLVHFFFSTKYEFGTDLSVMYIYLLCMKAYMNYYKCLVMNIGELILQHVKKASETKGQPTFFKAEHA